MTEEHTDLPGAMLPDDLVDGALRAALGAEETVFSTRRPESADEAPASTPSRAADAIGDSLERIGRYEVVEEVARGGVGAVLRGRDAEIGREVAIKLLLRHHAGNPDMARRLIEEGQIAGQLQHPGIVPVHELGRGEDRRPFFTMKLVRGETLASLLASRRDAGERRQHYLRIVLQVCEAIAYAHARGVVHRDLKPMNVMIGAFGEVQLMDWGLAKVLTAGCAGDAGSGVSGGPGERQATRVETIRSGDSDSRSLAGTVMGTPAYMAPEQARGEPDQIDQRTDVFGLGAILCDVLTGKPPHTGETVAEVLEKAKAGDVSSARARLEACGADAALVTLALRCLSPEKVSRPRNADEVSRALREYLESLEERARSLELESAEARVRAEGERKTRVRTLGAGAVLLSVFAALIVVVGILVARSENEQVTRSLRERLRGALDALDDRLAALEGSAFARLRSIDFSMPGADAGIRALGREEPLVAQPFAIDGSEVLWPPFHADSSAVEIPWKDAAASTTEHSLLEAVYEHLAAGERDQALIALRAIVRLDPSELSFSARAESAFQLVTLLVSAPESVADAVLELDRLLAAMENPPPAQHHAMRQWRFAALDRKVELLIGLERRGEAAGAALALLGALTEDEVRRRHGGARDLYLPRLRKRDEEGRLTFSAEERRRWNELLVLAEQQDRETAFRGELERVWRPRIESLRAAAAGGSPKHLYLSARGDDRGPSLVVVAPREGDEATLGFLAAWSEVEDALLEALASVRRPDEPPVASGIVDPAGEILVGDALPAIGTTELLRVEAPRGRPWRAWIDPAPLRAEAERNVVFLFGGFVAADLAVLAIFAIGAARGAFGARRAAPPGGVSRP